MSHSYCLRISARTDYALRALLVLAAAPDDEPVKARALAKAENIPVKFLATILVELRRTGILASRRGAGGGYCLARPAALISVADVVRAVEQSNDIARQRSAHWASERRHEGPPPKLRSSDRLPPTPPATAPEPPSYWIVLRESVRATLELVTLDGLVAGAAIPGPATAAVS
jgi:Rrf2 family protein